MNWKIPLSDPLIGEDELHAVAHVLKSQWLTMGEVTAELEKKFAEKLGSKHAIAVSNGTAALHLANLALGIGEGDEVICPALTFVATANASRYTGAKVVFADVISEDDLTINPKEIKKKISNKTKAISVVHYAGFPCVMQEIMSIAQGHGLRVIEDCAHALFAAIKGRFVGTIGDIGCFSFFSNKNMTCGEGGMVTTNDDRLAEKIKLLRSHGMTTSTYDRHQGSADTYDVVELGYNYRIDEIRSAIALCQLKKIDKWNQERRQVYRSYIEAFHGNSNVVIPFADRDLSQSACHIFPILIKKGLKEIKASLKDAGIQTSRHYTPIDQFSIYQGSNPVTKAINPDELLTLPLSPTVTKENVEYIVEIIKG